VQASFNFIIAITLLLTSFIVHKINKLHAIYACSIFASIATILLFFVSNDIFRVVFIFLVGILFGISQLAFSTYFWNLTVPAERGRVGGLIGFVSLPFYFVGIVAARTVDFLGTVILSIVLNMGTLAVILVRPEKAILTAKKDERENYSEKKTVLLYSIPWVLFSLINFTLAKNVSLNIEQQVPPSFYVLLILLQTIAAIFGTLGGGIIADFFGRRLSLAFSVTSYGISSAFAGLIQNEAIFCFVYIANGLSWGILLTLYTFVIWGDLANKENCAKMYSIGFITLYLTTGIGLITPTPQFSLVVSALLSCFLIFLSNVPLALAPELLPSDFREEIKLKRHMNAVRKISKKSQNQG
jgi:MFS family permease